MGVFNDWGTNSDVATYKFVPNDRGIVTLYIKDILHVLSPTELVLLYINPLVPGISFNEYPLSKLISINAREVDLDEPLDTSVETRAVINIFHYD